MNQAQQPNQDELLERTLREAGSIGKTWARYGLVAGQTALETSALTLKKVAGLLGDLSAQFKDSEPNEEVVVAEGETVTEAPATKPVEDTDETTQH